MARVVKRKLHSRSEAPWGEVSAEERLEAVEIISGIRKGKEAEQPFSRPFIGIESLPKIKAASSRAKDKIDFEKLKRIIQNERR